MLDMYKELTPVVYGESGVRLLHIDNPEPGSLCFQTHWHDRMELLYVTGGCLELCLGDQAVTVERGGVAIVGPRQPHQGLAGPGGVVYETCTDCP